MHAIGRRVVLCGALGAVLVGLFPLGAAAAARSERQAVHAAADAALTPAAEPAAGAHDLLPDMKMAPLYGMALQTISNGRKHLTFGTIGWNVGDGPLEARGRKVDPGDGYMQFKQRIYNSAGGHRDRVTPGVMIYDTGDHHNHWHVRQFMVVQMYTRNEPNGDVYGLRKIGYCLLDARRMGNPPPHSPSPGKYPFSACGTKSSKKVTMGLSIGYGDDYPPYFAHQWMDITGLDPGVYRICTTVDPLGEFEEKNESNNQRWTDVRIDLAQHKVTVLGTAVAPCGPSVPVEPGFEGDGTAAGVTYGDADPGFVADEGVAPNASASLIFSCHIPAPRT